METTHRLHFLFVRLVGWLVCGEGREKKKKKGTMTNAGQITTHISVLGVSGLWQCLESETARHWNTHGFLPLPSCLGVHKAIWRCEIKRKRVIRTSTSRCQGAPFKGTIQLCNNKRIVVILATTTTTIIIIIAIYTELNPFLQKFSLYKRDSVAGGRGGVN